MFMNVRRGSRLPDWYEAVKTRAGKLKSESVTLYYAYLDPRTPWYARLLITFTLAYLFSPVDLIPDFIPVLGQLDDLIIVPLCIAWSIKLIPAEVIREAREKALCEGGQGKRANWIFGTAVILVWMLVVYWVFLKVWPLTGRHLSGT
jgi:uncharacterized membrane protein YkvA (DUF1232 family)